MAYRWMMLYSLAQSYPVFPTPPLPVVSTRFSVPPARIEPVFWSIRISCMHAGFGMAKPLFPQAVPSASVNVVTSCWSI